MGEYADMLINGLCCQECGEVMDDFKEPGFARLCPSCKTPKEKKKTTDPTAMRWLNVKDEESLAKLKWLCSQRLKGKYNCFDGRDRRDKNNMLIVVLYWDKDPNSDWAKSEPVSGIIFRKESLYDRGYAIIEQYVAK